MYIELDISEGTLCSALGAGEKTGGGGMFVFQFKFHKNKEIVN
jgi:hypothetical protein